MFGSQSPSAKSQQSLLPSISDRNRLPSLKAPSRPFTPILQSRNPQERPASAFELLPVRGRPPYLKDVKIEENPLPHGPWEANGELTSVPEANTCRGNTTTVALDQTADQGESDTETRVRTAR